MQSRMPDSFNSDVYLATLAAAFLLDRKAQNLTVKTRLLQHSLDT